MYTDKEMIRLLTDKNPLGFCKVVKYITEQIAQQTYQFVMQQGGKETDVDEVLNDALLMAHQFARDNKFKAHTKILGFVYVTAKNIVRNKMRKRKVSPVIHIEDMINDIKDTEQQTKEDNHFDNLNEVMLTALNQLKSRDKTLIMDFYSDNLSMKAIAEKFNLGSEQAARNKKCRIIKRLRKRILHIQKK